MGDDLRIQAVCGFGCGSSLFLKIKIDKVLKEHNLSARTFCGDVGTAASVPCEVIFCSDEIAERLESRATVPVVRVKNFRDDAEVEEKVLEYFNTLKEEN